MKDDVKPSLRSNADLLILHVGTNDLSSNELGRSIIDLATSVKNEKHDVSISNIIIRTDDKKTRKKEV